MCNLYTMTATVDELRRVLGTLDGEIEGPSGQVKPLRPLPKSTESYSYCLAIYAASIIAAKERNHSRDFPRLKDSVLGVSPYAQF
jgi:hypothetical protein